jgi:ABC-type transporter Mla maintaining outer membrane lipid asymmetry permease subunit MlaE
LSLGFRVAGSAICVPALPIITIISLLTGSVLALVDAVQLQQFGTCIYVADLVGIAIAREMGAAMTGIVMAGCTGSAFAAQIGAMQNNEEIDRISWAAVICACSWVSVRRCNHYRSGC